MKEGKKLVDSSIWINYFKGTKGMVYEELTLEIIEGGVVTCPVIIQEVLQGAESEKEYKKIKEYFLGLQILLLDQVEAAIKAADLFRKLRKRGITIRKPNDCLIAYYCIHFGIPILH